MLTISRRRMLVVVLIAGLVFLSGAVALAQEDTGTTTEDAGETTVEENATTKEIDDIPGILPTNPFYFFKEFNRGVRRFFIFDPSERAEFELEIIGEKARELRAVEGLNPENTEAINRAIDNYNESVDRLRVNLERLSDNPNVGELVERLEERAGRHNELFEDLMERHEELGHTIDDARLGFMEAQMFVDRFRHRLDEDENEGEQEREREGEDGDEDSADDTDENDSDDADEVDVIDNTIRRGGFFPPGGEMICLHLYEPVCGEDEETYSNKCFARIAGVKIQHEGACEE